MDMSKGWVKLPREIFDWQWYQEQNVKDVYLHLLLKANFKDKEWEGITVKRGQLITSREHLAEELKMGVQKVRTALKKLESTNDIIVEATNKYTIVTVVNYDEMQGDGSEINQLVTSNQLSNNQPVTTTKEIKNKKNERRDIGHQTKFAFMEDYHTAEEWEALYDN